MRAWVGLSWALAALLSGCGLSSIGGDLPKGAGQDVAFADAWDSTGAADQIAGDVADAGPDAPLPGTDAASLDVADSDAHDSNDGGDSAFLPDDFPPDGGCGSAADCDDGDACTTDKCDPAKGCSHVAIVCEDQDACTQDSCDVTLGCVHTATTCDDGDACTDDNCDVKLGCAHTATNCDDNNACTQDSCDVKLGCVNTPTSCDDNDACTNDSCDVTLGCAHTATNCDDSNACTNDSCDVTLGCAHTTTSCDDANPCSADSCDPPTGCTHTALDGQSCDDGDVCTSGDACTGLSCGGQFTRWLGTLDGGGDAAAWVGNIPRAGGTRLLIGWRETVTGGASTAILTQRVDATGQPLGTLQVTPLPESAVVTRVDHHGDDVLLSGVVRMGPTMTQPWFALLDATDSVTHHGTYEPLTTDDSSGRPRAAWGKTVTGAGGKSFTRWFTSVDGIAVFGYGRHSFYSIDPDGIPQYHTLGQGNDDCGAIRIEDGKLIGTCDVKDSTDYFHAAFDQDGHVTQVVRTSPVVPTQFTAVAALTRDDGHVWYLGQMQGNAATTALVGVSPSGALVKIATLALGKSATVHAVRQLGDGTAWLAGTDGQDAALWRLDPNAALVGTRTYGAGTWLGLEVDAGGVWLAGTAGATALPWTTTGTSLRAGRTDGWGLATCTATDPCILNTACDDGNPCTSDWCDSACTHVGAQLCDDGDACTYLAPCTLGSCGTATPANCDDGSPCTIDACTSTGCSHTPGPDFAPCDDGSVCTNKDICLGGKCGHTFAQSVGSACGTDGVCSAILQCVTPWAASIVAGNHHSCAIAVDGRIWCWGDNSNHELGNSKLAASYAPQEVPGSSNWAPSSIVMDAGDGFNVAWVGSYAGAQGWGRTDKLQANVDTGGKYTLTSSPQDASSGLTAPQAIALGSNHGCLLTQGGSVTCWGASDLGQCGVVSASSKPITVGPLPGAKAIAVGGNTSCALLNDGTVSCWGERAGAWSTGSASSSASSQPVAVQGLANAATLAIGPNHGCAYSTAKVLRCWGANDKGQVGAGTQGTVTFAAPTVVSANNLVDLAAGDDFTCAVTVDGYVLCWGDGAAGQLGDGKLADHDLPTPIPNFSGAVQVVAGGQHACARRADGAVFCWGTGGIPGMAASPIPVAVPDSLPPSAP